jgi:ankyrin repeat protein
MARLNGKILAVAVGASLLLAQPGYAAKLKKVKKAAPETTSISLIIKRNYAGAFAKALAQANTGNAGAQYQVGVYYRLGLGTPKDPAEALQWLALSSQAGNGRAKALLGRLSHDTPATVKKTVADGGVALADAVNFAKLPPRAAGQPDWLTLAVARKSADAIGAISALQRPSSGGTVDLALVTAVRNADAATTQKLLDAKVAVKPDTRGRSPLMVAVSLGNDDLTSILSKGAGFGADKNEQLKLAGYASEKCLPSLMVKLAESGNAPKPNLVSIAKNCTNWQDFKTFFAGADLNAVDGQGRSAAWYAAAKGDTQFLVWLAKAGADLALADQTGLSPLHAAAVNKQAFSVRYILSVFDQVDIVSKRGTTPLMLAAASGCIECISALVEKSAKVDLKNLDGDTSLMFAVIAGQRDAATLLLKQGANLDARNEASDTPGKMAERVSMVLAQ